jgi:hypothetical protein
LGRVIDGCRRSYECAQRYERREQQGLVRQHQRPVEVHVACLLWTNPSSEKPEDERRETALKPPPLEFIGNRTYTIHRLL